MNSETSLTEDSNTLLRELLDYDQLQRKEIQTELHTKIGDLNKINFELYHIEKDMAAGKLDQKRFQEIKLLVNQSIDDMRTVMGKIFSADIKMSGLNTALQSIVPFCRDKYSTEVAFSSDLVEEKGKVSMLTELGVYKVCFETAQFLCLTGHKEIVIRLEPVGKNVVVDLIGLLKANVEVNEEALLERLNLIKANLVWRTAQILPGTNWKNSFQFQFNYEKN